MNCSQVKLSDIDNTEAVEMHPGDGDYVPNQQISQNFTTISEEKINKEKEQDTSIFDDVNKPNRDESKATEDITNYGENIVVEAVTVNVAETKYMTGETLNLLDKKHQEVGVDVVGDTIDQRKNVSKEGDNTFQVPNKAKYNEEKDSAFTSQDAVSTPQRNLSLDKRDNKNVVESESLKEVTQYEEEGNLYKENKMKISQITIENSDITAQYLSKNKCPHDGSLKTATQFGKIPEQREVQKETIESSSECRNLHTKRETYVRLGEEQCILLSDLEKSPSYECIQQEEANKDKSFHEGSTSNENRVCGVQNDQKAMQQPNNDQNWQKLNQKMTEVLATTNKENQNDKSSVIITKNALSKELHGNEQDEKEKVITGKIHPDDSFTSFLTENNMRERNVYMASGDNLKSPVVEGEDFVDNFSTCTEPPSSPRISDVDLYGTETDEHSKDDSLNEEINEKSNEKILESDSIDEVLVPKQASLDKLRCLNDREESENWSKTVYSDFNNVKCVVNINLSPDSATGMEELDKPICQEPPPSPASRASGGDSHECHKDSELLLKEVGARLRESPYVSHNVLASNKREFWSLQKESFVNSSMTKPLEINYSPNASESDSQQNSEETSELKSGETSEQIDSQQNQSNTCLTSLSGETFQQFEGDALLFQSSDLESNKNTATAMSTTAQESKQNNTSRIKGSGSCTKLSEVPSGTEMSIPKDIYSTRTRLSVSGERLDKESKEKDYSKQRENRDVKKKPKERDDITGFYVERKESLRNAVGDVKTQKTSKKVIREDEMTELSGNDGKAPCRLQSQTVSSSTEDEISQHQRRPQLFRRRNSPPTNVNSVENDLVSGEPKQQADLIKIPGVGRFGKRTSCKPSPAAVNNDSNRGDIGAEIKGTLMKVANDKEDSSLRSSLNEYFHTKDLDAEIRAADDIVKDISQSTDSCLSLSLTPTRNNSYTDPTASEVKLIESLNTQSWGVISATGLLQDTSFNHIPKESGSKLSNSREQVASDLVEENSEESPNNESSSFSKPMSDSISDSRNEQILSSNVNSRSSQATDSGKPLSVDAWSFSVGEQVSNQRCDSGNDSQIIINNTVSQKQNEQIRLSEEQNIVHRQGAESLEEYTTKVNNEESEEINDILIDIVDKVVNERPDENFQGNNLDENVDVKASQKNQEQAGDFTTKNKLGNADDNILQEISNNLGLDNDALLKEINESVQFVSTKPSGDGKDSIDNFKEESLTGHKEKSENDFRTTEGALTETILSTGFALKEGCIFDAKPVQDFNHDYVVESAVCAISPPLSPAAPEEFREIGDHGYPAEEEKEFVDYGAKFDNYQQLAGTKSEAKTGSINTLNEDASADPNRLMFSPSPRSAMRKARSKATKGLAVKRSKPATEDNENSGTQQQSEMELLQQKRAGELARSHSAGSSPFLEDTTDAAMRRSSKYTPLHPTYSSPAAAVNSFNKNSGVRKIKVVDVEDYPKDRPSIYHTQRLIKKRIDTKKSSDSVEALKQVKKQKTVEPLGHGKHSVWGRVVKRFSTSGFVLKYNRMISTKQAPVVKQAAHMQRSLKQGTRSSEHKQSKDDTKLVTAFSSAQDQNRTGRLRKVRRKKASMDSNRIRRLKTLRASAEQMVDGYPALRRQSVSIKNYIRPDDKTSTTAQGDHQSSKRRTAPEDMVPDLVENEEGTLSKNPTPKVQPEVCEVFNKRTKALKSDGSKKTEATVRMLMGGRSFAQHGDTSDASGQNSVTKLVHSMKANSLPRESRATTLTTPDNKNTSRRKYCILM